MKPHRVVEPQHTATADPLLDRVLDRVLDILDGFTDVAVVDCADGSTILEWGTAQAIARAIATDRELEARIIEACEDTTVWELARQIADGRRAAS